MRLIEVIPLTKIPLPQPQLLSYFFGRDLSSGTLVLVPLGKRQEKAVVIETHDINDFKMEIKKAGYELRPIKKVISAAAVLTHQQLELALWLGQYYFTPPGLFAKMMMPKIYQKSKIKNQNGNSKLKNDEIQKLIIAPTIFISEKIAINEKNAVLWHSELTKKQLNEIWWKIKSGEIQTIIGTRSAVFLPFTNLKEIIIKDETNPGHKSWDMWPHHRVHEVVKKLAEIFNAKLIFKNKVPSVESYFYERAGKFPKSDIQYPTSVIDMRAEIKEGNFSIFSRELQKAIGETLAQKGQIILFINRRGAANFVLCRDCGYTVKCPNCDSPLAHHLRNQKPTLFCHRCGHQEKVPPLCPQCQSWRVKTVGGGTQKVELEAKKLFSQAKIARLDSDSAPSQKEQQKIIEAFAKKEIDVLIATQIIFSWLDEIKPAPPATVALVSADTLLHLPDFHSGERTFQTIVALRNLLFPSFVKGGLGRISPDKNPPQSPFAKGGGTFIIQTYNPENSVIKYAATDDWESFYQEEIEARKLLGYPPFSQIVKLTFRHRDPKKTGQEAKILAAKLSLAAAPLSGAAKLKQVMILPPLEKEGWGGFKKIPLNPPFAKGENWAEISDALPAFIPKEKGKYVWNIIIKFKLPENVILNLFQDLVTYPMSSEFLRSRNSLLQYVPSNWEINVDPSDLL